MSASEPYLTAEKATYQNLTSFSFLNNAEFNFILFWTSLLRLLLLSSRATPSWGETRCFSTITYGQSNSLLCGWNLWLKHSKLKTSVPPLFLRWCGSSLNVWFHSPPQDYRQKVKAYMCMCSCHEWIMYSDSRDRWIYDHQLKRIAVTLNQEVLVKSCYNSQRWTHCRSLSVLPRSSPTIRVQESLKFQICTKLPKIASCHFQLKCLQTQTAWRALHQCSLSPSPRPHPVPGRWF